ncbi:MAG: T9SS type A sorting domain-containing protein, partial [Saprospiraceae bacterium]|nr:T9SS type A sorting domain-containing protein [Saprospiraceae bacterium]
VESVTITENFTEPTAVIDAPTTQLDCNVSSITLDATGSTGQGILFYDWTGGSTDPTLEVTSAGDYSITITDAANQCTSVATITITDNFTNPTALIDAPATELTCEVTSIELNAAISFGQGDLSYEWTGGSTDSTLVVTTAGDYSVTVTDPVNGCSAVASVTITQDGNVPTAVIDAPETQLDCDTGSIILDASGSTGQGTLTYEWTGGSTGSTLEVTVAGDYGVTITDSTNGCTAEASITITENYIAPTAVIDAPATQLDCTTGSIILDASGSMGQGTLSYEWTGGSTGATLVVALAGDYSVTVTDSANGCTAVNMITITQDSDVPVAMIDTPIMELDCNVLAIILDASGSTGVNPLTYEWTGGSTNAALEVTMGGVYSVTVTDSQNGCTSATSINITENYTSPSIIWFTPTTQLDCDTGSIVVDASGSTGQGMLTYEWTGGSTGSTLEVTAAGEYFVTLTDAANGCSSSSSITITENYTTPSASIDVPTTQLDCNVASIALDASGSMGQGALTYEWTGGSTNATLDVTMVGDYFVTVSDGANGCQSVTFVSITQDLLAPNAVITPPAITLLDCNNPTITLDAGPSSGQGVLSYEWTGGGTNATLEVTSAGDYFVTVTDAQNGCTAVDMVTLTEDFMAPVVVIETPLGTQLDCDTEMLTINAGNSTGQGVLSYEWTGGSTNPSLEVTAPGNYSVTISDSQNGCTAIETIVITQDMGNVMVSYNDPVCVGDELELFNTNTATQWQWEGPDDFTSTIQNPTISQVTTAASGIYFVTITETSGCTYVGSVDVVVNTIPEINITGSEEVCEQGTIDLTEDAGDAVSWSWSGPDSFSASSGNINISMVSELQQGVYQVNITDINGCVNSDQIDIAINDLPLVEIISSSPVCTDEDLELHEVGGNAIEWSWTGPDGFTASTSDVFVSSNQVLGGTYLVTITGENGCTATAETIVSTVQGQLIESNFLVGNMACLGDSLRFIDYTNIDIDTTATFFWDFGNGDTSTERDPVYVYHTSGLFDIQLEILSGSCPNFSMVKSVGIVDCLKQPFGLINASLRPTINDGQFDIYVELIDKGDVLLEIYDVNGKKIQSDFYQNIDSLEKSITIREVGIYFVQIGHKNGVEILRAIVIE